MNYINKRIDTTPQEVFEGGAGGDFFEKSSTRKNDQTSTRKNDHPRKARTYALDVTQMGVMAAILVGVKYVLQALPNFEVVSGFIVLFTCVFGFRKTFVAVLVFCILDNFLYAFFLLVTIQYFIHFPLLCIVTKLIIRSNKLCVVARPKQFLFYKVLLTINIAAFAVFFWIQTPIITHIAGFTPFLPTLIAGIPFMFPMLFAGIAFMIVLFTPLYSALSRVES
ncbi:MAG: hypothetical protein FWB72_05630 [Firmicutes bacterium]|nr:hypothetical protein [Bacillota bacterium]